MNNETQTTNASETARAQTFAREVSYAMLKLRGWDPKTAPRAVVDDVHHTLARHESLYAKAFADSWKPKGAARAIQYAEWDSPSR